MNNKKFQTFFDCGSSKVRAGVFNLDNKNDVSYDESEFFTDPSHLESKIEKMIISFEKNTNEYIDNINLMIDSPKMLSIGISMSKKFYGSKLKKTNIQFLVQEAKQQILKYYPNHNIIHIIINNYTIDGVDHSYLPGEIRCDFISLDILFLCLPNDLVLYFKNIYSKFNISINQIICSSYAKSIFYKNNLNLKGHVSFIDVGFNRTSIISYFNEKILYLDILPVGGNHITKDISKIFKIDLEKSELVKCNFDKNQKISNDTNISIEELKKIITARAEEIIELCTKSIESNSHISKKFKMVLMGDGAKVFNNKYIDNQIFSDDIYLPKETPQDICQSGFRFLTKRNKQEVIVVPKKQIKHGFFEKFFHFFR